MKIELSKMEIAIISDALTIATKVYNDKAKYSKGFYSAPEVAKLLNKAMNAQTVRNGIDVKARGN